MEPALSARQKPQDTGENGAKEVGGKDEMVARESTPTILQGDEKVGVVSGFKPSFCENLDLSDQSECLYP